MPILLYADSNLNKSNPTNIINVQVCQDEGLFHFHAKTIEQI